jgi:hypothetical protein
MTVSELRDLNVTEMAEVEGGMLPLLVAFLGGMYVGSLVTACYYLSNQETVYKNPKYAPGGP